MGHLISKNTVKSGKHHAVSYTSVAKDAKPVSTKTRLNLTKKDKTELIRERNSAYNYLTL